jgi:NAD(P)-dependent dehydrogenase (short-subunit alcohol dehydrogenase family)
MMGRVLIAGAGGGIGHAMVDSLICSGSASRVWALHRRPVSSTHPDVTWLQADVTDPSSLGEAADVIRDGGGLDALIVSSGMLHHGDLAPEKSLADLNADHLQRLYAVNAVGPLMVLKACRDLLRGSERPIVCFLSAQVGSIADNRLGGWYGYRMAKAALNMAVKTASIELSRQKPSPIVVAVHPGTTRTALSNRFVEKRRKPVATAAEAAEQIVTLLEDLEPEDTGAFFDRTGEPLPW